VATVELRQVRKRFGPTEVIQGIDLTIRDRELTVFVGPSGCGKSTLLRLIAGLEEITSGELLIDGIRMNEVPPAKRGLALVFQSYALYPHMNVAENMAFSLKLAGMPKEERNRRVQEAAALLHLEPYLERKPKALSGGQRQRVAIGRAIVRSPKVFLFDEPLSNLDAALRARMRLELTRLHKQLNATMIYVTHDQVEAMTMADRIVVLHDGAVEQTGSPMELYRSPRNRFVAEFIGSPKMNFLQVKSARMHSSTMALTLLDGTTLHIPSPDSSRDIGDELTVGIRPEHIALAREGGLLARVQMIERLGSLSHLYVQTPGGEELVVSAGGEVRVAVDEEVRLCLAPSFVHLFDKHGNAVERSRSQASPENGQS
jgi:multiple sugar transport system ATP-binding protein